MYNKFVDNHYDDYAKDCAYNFEICHPKWIIVHFVS